MTKVRYVDKVVVLYSKTMGVFIGVYGSDLRNKKVASFWVSVLMNYPMYKSETRCAVAVLSSPDALREISISDRQPERRSFDKRRDFCYNL